MVVRSWFLAKNIIHRKICVRIFVLQIMKEKNGTLHSDAVSCDLSLLAITIRIVSIFYKLDEFKPRDDLSKYSAMYNVKIEAIFKICISIYASCIIVLRTSLVAHHIICALY
jgi:hypothetical protein